MANYYFDSARRALRDLMEWTSSPQSGLKIGQSAEVSEEVGTAIEFVNNAQRMYNESLAKAQEEEVR